MIHYGDVCHHSVFYLWIFYFLTVSKCIENRGRVYQKCIKSIKKKKFYEDAPGYKKRK